MGLLAYLVILLLAAVGSAAAQTSATCTYRGGYPFTAGGCLTADDLNAAIADAKLKPNTLSWGAITSTPTTLAGYGVTGVPWSLLTGTPTTLAGYGVTSVPWNLITTEPAKNNGDLASLNSALYPNGIWRNGVLVPGDASPVRYIPSGSICSLTTATFIGSIAGSVLTVSSITSGNLRPGLVLAGIGVPAGLMIASNGTGTGGTGNYNLSATAAISSQGMNTPGDVGSQVPDAVGQCWTAVSPPAGWMPEMFGAATNGTSNVTTAVQAAANAAAGGTLKWGPHLYCITQVTIPNNTRVVGQSRMGTAAAATSGLRACATNVNGLLLLNHGDTVDDFYIDTAYSGANTSGAAIKTNPVDVPSNVNIFSVWVHQPCIGMDLSGNTITVRDSYIENMVGSGCGGIRGGADTTGATTADLRLHGVTVASFIATPADYDVELLDCGGCGIDGYSDLLFAKRGLKIIPGANQTVSGGQFVNSALGDTNTEYGVSIDTAAASAQVHDHAFTGTWSSSATLHGFLIANNGAGVVDDISLVNHRSLNNGQMGFDIVAGTNIKILGGSFCNNSQSANQTYDDIRLESGVSGVQISGDTFQGVCGWSLGANKPAFAVNLIGSNADTQITNNKMLGAFLVPIAGTPTGNSIVDRNQGVDTAGVTAVASAATIALNAVYPNWNVTGTTTITTINNFWNGRPVKLFANLGSTGSVPFATGGNICNAITVPAGTYVNATYVPGASCWALK